ncbi:MAG TPA: hypothetical protein PLY35_12450 [Thermotogota bacterium]|nr:hypothetical protein [Thermotogota bacterium]
MDEINTILLLYLIYRLHLNGTAPKPPIRVVAPKEPEARVNMQYEKPVVPGAKPVKAVQIGDGKLNFDEQNQVAEWV